MLNPWFNFHHRTETSAGHEYHGHATEFLKRTIFSVSPPPKKIRDQLTSKVIRDLPCLACTQEDRSLITIIRDNREDLDNLFYGLMSFVDLCVVHVSLQIPLPSHISIHGNNEADKAAKSTLEFEIVNSFNRPYISLNSIYKLSLADNLGLL